MCFALSTHTKLCFSPAFCDMYLLLTKRVINHAQGVGDIRLKKKYEHTNI